jgi:NAD(P)-dependent dehydrogenase (short-subunit alcohol dehydrogenase family)
MLPLSPRIQPFIKYVDLQYALRQGKAIACRLAQEGFQVVAVGRGGEGRRAEVLSFLEECAVASSSAATEKGSAAAASAAIKHEFRPCDAFDLSQVKRCAADIERDYGDDVGGIDALVMTQGMATTQKFTPTVDGNDEKLTLHFWSRAAFASSLLPALRRSSRAAMPGGSVVLTVLSGGVHSPYGGYRADPELKSNYSIANAANFAGYYTDLFFDKLASRPANASINFVHAAPGFVATNWGTEMPSYLRGPIRAMQKLMGKSPAKCAGYMVGPILRCGHWDIGLELSSLGGGGGKNATAGRGVYIMKEDGTSGKLTKVHTVEAMDAVWGTTRDVLGRAGIELAN